MSRKWDKIYRRYIENENLSYIELGERMDQYRPVKMYRYMRFDEYWDKNIFEGQVYLSEASSLNDPFDCLVYVNHKTYIEYMFQAVCYIFPGIDRNVLRETVKSSIDDEIDKQIFEMKKKFRVACFSENSKSPLMWAHYADSHRGFCLEYDLTQIPKGYKYGILPVVYSDKRYDATNAIIAKNTNLLMNPYYFKSSHWKYEKEWRMVISEDLATDNEYYADFCKGISGIYLGLRSFEYHKEKIDIIIEEYSKRGFPVYKMSLEPSSYHLKSFKIN